MKGALYLASWIVVVVTFERGRQRTLQLWYLVAARLERSLGWGFCLCRSCSGFDADWEGWVVDWDPWR